MPAPETLFERIVTPVARARGGVYLSLGWFTKTPAPTRDRIMDDFDADGWLRVSESANLTLLYRADDDVDVSELRNRTVIASDGSSIPLQKWCSLESRSAAPEVAFADRVRRSILAHLGDMLATQGIGLNIDLAAYPHIGASVLNFGVELPIGATASQDALRRFEEAVAKAIRRFEPRLAPDSVTVDVMEPETALAKGVLQMQVAAGLSPAYGGKNVRFRTSIDLQTGRATASEEMAYA